MDSQASGSASNVVDINESGSGKVGESESEGAICLQDRLKWLNKPVVRKDLIVRLNKENGSIKQNLEATNAALRASKIEGSRASTSGTSSIKELADSVDGKNRSPKAVQYSPEIRKLKLELKQERDRLTNVQLKFREEQELNKSFREELKKLKSEREKTSKETSKIQNELNEKSSEIKHLQFELTRRQNEESAEAFDSLKRLIETLENENTTLKMEKSEIEAALEKSRKSFTEKMLSDALHIQKKDLSSINDMPDHSDNFLGKEEMERSLQKLSNDLKETWLDRDKALQELSRLKQHLLEKMFRRGDEEIYFFQQGIHLKVIPGMDYVDPNGREIYWSPSCYL